MGQSIVFPEWLNANTLRNYPIKENASRTDISGSFTIPNDLLVAAQINFSRDYVGGNFFISKIIFIHTYFFFTIEVLKRIS